jgi:hypothetical protein
VHAAAVGTGDLRGCDGWTGGGEGSLDERRRGKAGSGQRVRCDGRRDEGCSQQQQANGQWTVDSGSVSYPSCRSCSRCSPFKVADGQWNGQSAP